jgi:hypothetical protein
MRDIPNSENWVWSEDDVDRLRTAFHRRHAEHAARTESLFAVAAEGMRIYTERMAAKAKTSGENISPETKPKNG